MLALPAVHAVPRVVHHSSSRHHRHHWTDRPTPDANNNRITPDHNYHHDHNDKYHYNIDKYHNYHHDHNKCHYHNCPSNLDKYRNYYYYN
ncbi:uncharacterized protein LOC144100114 [Amblyomma americanum]